MGERVRRTGVRWNVLLGWLAGILLLGACFPGAPARAHQVNLLAAEARIEDGRRITLQLTMKGSDVDRVAGTAIAGAVGGQVDPARLAQARAAVEGALNSRTAVRNAGGAACAGGVRSLAAADDAVTAAFAYDCAGVPGELVYSSTVLVDVEPSARQVVLIGRSGGVEQAVIDAGRTTVSLTGPPPAAGEVVAQYIVSGVEHIFIGYDHIAFLLGLLLWARSPWAVVKIVTAFTVAHSITLSLAVLDVVALPSALVEAAIAASIVWVAVENFVSRDVSRRWRLTFLLGLVHGFGFAGVLREFGLPDSALAVALASFNVGVELGQIAIVSLAMPVLLVLDRAMARGAEREPRIGAVRPDGAVAAAGGRSAAVVYALSAVIALLGAYWLAERTVLV